VQVGDEPSRGSRAVVPDRRVEDELVPELGRDRRAVVGHREADGLGSRDVREQDGYDGESEPGGPHPEPPPLRLVNRAPATSAAAAKTAAATSGEMSHETSWLQACPSV